MQQEPTAFRPHLGRGIRCISRKQTHFLFIEYLYKIEFEFTWRPECGDWKQFGITCYTLSSSLAIFISSGSSSS